jgi:hypothetical protein
VLVTHLRQARITPTAYLIDTTMINTATDLKTMHALNKRFIHNFVTNDVASHRAILHPEFRTVTSAGGHVARGPYLEAWATGFDPEVIIYWDMRDERISLLADTALVTATNRWVRRQNGRDLLGMTCYTDSYVRTDGTWLCALAQITPVSPENYPGDDTIVVKYIRGQLQS